MSKLGDVIGVLFYVPMLGDFLGVLCREYPVSAKLGTVNPWFIVDDVGSLAGVYCFTNELFLLYSPVTWDSHCQFLTFFPFDCVRSLLNLYEVCSTCTKSAQRWSNVFRMSSCSLTEIGWVTLYWTRLHVCYPHMLW